MPRGKHIEVIIAPDGRCTVDAVNFVGPACHAATLEITTALGGQIDHERLKPEARLREQPGQNEREQAR